MTIFRKIVFHPLFLLTAFFVVLTGLFHEFFFFTSLILIHELGHAWMAKRLKWNVSKILIFPFGGVTLLEDFLNRPIKEELMILLAGPVTQIVYYHIVSFFYVLPQEFRFFHLALLFFNLLPIYPLDGGKLLHLLLEKVMPYKKSYFYFFFCSYGFLFLGFLFLCCRFSISIFFFLLFLLFKNWEGYRTIESIKERFLLERFLYSFSFKKWREIKGIDVDLMYREYGHIFHDGRKTYSEREILRKRFDFPRKVC